MLPSDPPGLLDRLVPVSTGATLHVVERPGAGAPVVCLHGIWDSWRAWRPLVPPGPGSFSPRPLLMLDLRGHGESSKPAAGYGLADYAADVVAFIRETPIPTLALAGHSLGALIALLVAAELPERITGMVLEDPPLPLPDPTPGATPDEMWLGFRDVTLGLYALKHQPVDVFVETVQAQQPEATRAEVEAFVATVAAAADGVFDELLTRTAADVEIPVPGVTLDLPALVIQAGLPEQTMLRPAGIAQLRAALPRMRLESIPNTRHSVFSSDPVAYRQAVAAFFGE